MEKQKSLEKSVLLLVGYMSIYDDLGKLRKTTVTAWPLACARIKRFFPRIIFLPCLPSFRGNPGSKTLELIYPFRKSVQQNGDLTLSIIPEKAGIFMGFKKEVERWLLKKRVSSLKSSFEDFTQKMLKYILHGNAKRYFSLHIFILLPSVTIEIDPL